MILSLLALAAAQAPVAALRARSDAAAPAGPGGPAQRAGAARPPPRSRPKRRYRACTDQVRTNPEAAVAAANAWREQGGGIAARQCLGLAYGRARALGAGGDRLRAGGARAEAASDPRRADFLVQAGNAWVAAGERPARARRFDAAWRPPASPTSCAARSISTAPAPWSRSAIPPRRAPRSTARSARPGRSDRLVSVGRAGPAREQSRRAPAPTSPAPASLAPTIPTSCCSPARSPACAGDMARGRALYRQVAQAAPEQRRRPPGAGEPRDHARGRGAGGPAPTSRRAQPAPAPAAAAACGTAQIEVEFDRRHDPHLLEAANRCRRRRLPRVGVAVARADREIALGRRADAADARCRCRWRSARRRAARPGSIRRSSRA